MEIVKACGGAHVQVIPKETYLCLDKGVIDGAFVTFKQIRDYKLEEVCNIFYNQDFGYDQGVILMNKEFYSGMSDEYRIILKKPGKRLLLFLHRKC
jgi:TRAP-type C4-dicarboxylate transport system substrate-binding protein